MKPLNQQAAIALVEQTLQNYKKIAPKMPEETIASIQEIPYGWHFTIGMKNPSCSNLYYGAYSNYIVDRDYRFIHLVHNLETAQEIAYYGNKRKEWKYRVFWRLGAFAKTVLVKGQLYVYTIRRFFA